MAHDAATGALTWLVDRRGTAKSGTVAGSLHSTGYLHVGVDGYLYKAHRLVWLMAYGAWPRKVLDHINGDKADNRLSNLRECTPGENCQNRHDKPNAAGYKGAYWNKTLGMYQAQIRHKRKLYALGYYATAKEAHQAYLDAKAKYHQFCPTLRGAPHEL